MNYYTLATASLLIVYLCPAQALITDDNDNHLSNLSDEIIVRTDAPKSKRYLKQKLEKLSDQLIAKLNKNASEDDYIHCRKEKRVINNFGGKRMVRVCHRNITHKGIDDSKKELFIKYNIVADCIIRALDTQNSICNTLVNNHDKTKNQETQIEAANINKRVKKLAKTDPEFRRLLTESKKLMDVYKQ